MLLPAIAYLSEPFYYSDVWSASHKYESLHKSIIMNRFLMKANFDGSIKLCESQ